MTLARLIGAFETFTKLPVEIASVRDELLRLGYQDDIIIKDGDFDPTQLRGVFYQYRVRETVYGDPQWRTLILYSKHLSLAWQRVVCCKELIHVLDGAAARTDTMEEFDALVEKLLGPLSTEDIGLADFQALKDRFAMYQALAILFPDDARTEILSMSPRPTDDEVAEWACLPKNLVQLVLSDAWPGLVQELIRSEELVCGHSNSRDNNP